ncbi:Transketolase [Verticillium dahliae VDG1]|nr:Transketolase [Verticillium dahliae VDG1]
MTLQPLPSLAEAKITTLPASAFYIPNFLSEEEEASILQKIAEAPKPRWKQLTHRRLQTWPSDLVHDKLIDAPLPRWLETPIVTRLCDLRRSNDDASDSLFSDSPHKRPNHVLINEYPPGVGIMPHKASLGKDDGALDPKPIWRILQEPRSLLITTDALYTDYLHGIADLEQDVELSADTVANWALLGSPESFSEGHNVRATRTSLTYRDVMKVSKLGSKFGFLGGR